MEKQVVLYSRDRCPLCDEARDILLEMKKVSKFELREIDISTEDDLTERYGLMIPVVTINGVEVQYGKINRDVIKNYLKS